MVKLLIQHNNMLKKHTLKTGGKIMSRGNRAVVPEARMALNQMKAEIASELGLANYESIDKGNLTSRQNGYVGGYMTKKLVETAERNLSGKM
jgi:hypothetical protein